MKQLLISIFIFGSYLSLAQSDSSHYEYCELVGTQRFLSSKVTISVDFGQERNYWKDPRVKDEQTGKVQVFNSMVDAMNYLGKDGWEFVQAYAITYQSSNVYHWLLKRRK